MSELTVSTVSTTNGTQTLALKTGNTTAGIIQVYGNGTISFSNTTQIVVDHLTVNGSVLAGKANTLNYIDDESSDLFLTPETVWDAQSVDTLTDAANIAVTFSSFHNFQVTLAGNRNLDNPSGGLAEVNRSGFIRIIQDATGSRTLTYSSYWRFAGGTAPSLSTGANAVDYLFYTVTNTTSIVSSVILDVS